MKKLTKHFLCCALTAMMAFTNHVEMTVYAAEESAQTKKSQSQDSLAKEPQSQDSQTKESQSQDSQTKESQSQNSQTSKDGVSSAESVLTEEELKAYYSDAVFIGDSIMIGFRNYSAKQETYVHDIQFLAVGSYSAFNAMKPVSADNVHPVYKGKKYQVWDAVPLIGSKRAFILLGMNDISILGLEGARDKYKELIDKILETSPDIEIHIISVTYTLADQGIGKLNNENLAKYNILLQEMAEENDWGYIDLCTPISDGKGNLAKEYCSDGFVHLSPSAYTLWESKLTDYANEQAALEEEETEEETASNQTSQKETQSRYETILETNPTQQTKGGVQ